MHNRYMYQYYFVQKLISFGSHVRLVLLVLVPRGRVSRESLCRKDALLSCAYRGISSFQDIKLSFIVVPHQKNLLLMCPHKHHCFTCTMKHTVPLRWKLTLLSQLARTSPEVNK